MIKQQPNHPDLQPSNVGGLYQGGRVYLVAVCDDLVWKHAKHRSTIDNYITGSHRSDEDFTVGVACKVGNRWHVNFNI